MDISNLQSSQLHILPCGNKESYEYEISILNKNGIDPKKENRFFYEEPGHLRSLRQVNLRIMKKRSGLI
jgi:hypothetical protein